MRLPRLIPLTVAVSVFAVTASPASAHNRHGGELVVGAGHALATDFGVGVVAGPHGQHPTGVLSLNGFFTFTATPTCVRIKTNVAVVGYRIQDGALAGQGFLAAVQDNGLPVNGQPVDTLIYSGTLASPPTKCPAPGAPPPVFTIDSGGGPLTTGDITVIGPK
jgi:hypothetical protein